MSIAGAAFERRGLIACIVCNSAKIMHMEGERKRAEVSLRVDVGDRPFRSADEYETFSFSEPGRPGCTYKNVKRPTSGWLLDKLGY